MVDVLHSICGNCGVKCASACNVAKGNLGSSHEEREREGNDWIRFPAAVGVERIAEAVNRSGYRCHEVRPQLRRIIYHMVISRRCHRGQSNNPKEPQGGPSCGFFISRGNEHVATSNRG
jgi:hypothetical protein